MGNSASNDSSPGAKFLAGCPAIPPPPSDYDVQSEFVKVLQTNHVASTVADELCAIETIEAKWLYVCLNKYLATPEAADKELLDPSVCVQEIQDPQLHLDSLHDLFRAVRINMLLTPREWIDKFLHAGGVKALVLLLDPTKAVSPLVHVEALNTLLALSHTTSALDCMVQTDDFCDRLVGLFTSSTSTAQRGRILKLLGIACCHHQPAQHAVVAAINRGPSSEPAKLALLSRRFAHSEDDRAFQLAILTFVNVVVNTTLAAAERLAVREDLEKHGFVTLLERYRSQGEESMPPAMWMQLQTFVKSHTSDRAKTTGGIQRRLSLNIPSATEEPTQDPGEPVASSSSPAVVVVAAAEESSTVAEKVLSTPRSLQARKSLRLEMTELHTETEEVNRSALVSPPPAPDPMQRRPSGSLLPSLSIPKVSVAFGPPKSVDFREKLSKAYVSLSASQPVAASNEEAKAAPSLESILATLQQGTKSLDEQTNQKLLNLLASLATSITTEGSSCGKVVAKLEQTLTGSKDTSRCHRLPDSSPVLPPPARLTLRLPTRYSDSDVYALATGTPMKPSMAGLHGRFHGDGSSFGATAASQLAPRSPSHSHCEEEPSPRRSMTETESYDESSHEYEMQARSKTSGAKNALAGFFQHLKKGQGLPTTPAPTPMATASVKKDARRPVFPSFATSSAAPSPMPMTRGHVGSFALPPLTPLKPSISVSLPPLTPMRSQVVATMATIKSPRGNEQHLEAVREEEAEASSPAATSLSREPDIGKFRKLLTMGAPRAAVRAKMQQAGLDPDLLDRPEQPSKQLPAASPVASPDPATTASSGPDISKFRKLLTMGAPMAAVKAKMQQAGLDPTLLDQLTASSRPVAVPAPALLTVADASTAASPLTSTKVKDDPAYAKFFKLRSMGAPAEAVKAKIRQAGLNPDLLDTPDADMPSASPSAVASLPAPAPEPVVRVRDDPEYAKFFKLLSMGAPPAAVKAKMQQAGVNPDLLDTPDAPVPSKTGNNNNSEHAPEPAAKMVQVKDHPDYVKFFKLKTMAPVEVVKAKMRQAGLDADLLDTPEAEMPSKAGPETPETTAPSKLGGAGAGTAVAGILASRKNPSAEASNQSSSNQATVLVKDDPAYAKFFKLVAMGAPAETVKGKMQMAGLRPELLDTPDALLTPAGVAASSSNQTSNNAGAAPAAVPARRANLTLSIKPPSAARPTTRPLYWQQLKGDSIRGTIWEEMEAEQRKENNELPLFLGDPELGLLEKEFPAQTAPMTGPGKQARSLSMDQLPNAVPMSPRVVFLIDRGRANNISIIIKQFRMSHAAIREATMKVDANVLTLERVQGLIKILPTDEEVAAITNYQGDPMALNEAERVLKELITVPRLKQRLTAMQAKLQFPQFVRDLQHKVDKLRAASAEVGQSAELKAVLQIVLQVGNRMNQGTARGGAKGFRLGDLPKLSQLKAVDKTSTLLHYVARMIRQKKGNSVRLSESLSSLYDVQNIPIPELPAEMGKVGEIVDYVTNEVGAQTLKNAIEEKESCDQFVKVMGEFLATASTITTALKAELDVVMKLMKDTMQRFGFQGDGDASDDTSSPSAAAATRESNFHAVLASAGEFFMLIYEFSVALMKADRENEVKRLREEARAKQIAKPKTPALGPRSMSSRDMMIRRATVVVDKKKDGVASESGASSGPETPEMSNSKDNATLASPPGGRVSPMLRQRSASLSAIVENNVNIEAILSALPGKLASPRDKPLGSSTEKKAVIEGGDSGKPTTTMTTPSKKADTPESKPSSIKPPTKFVLPSGAGSNGKDTGSAGKPKAPLLVPGKVAKCTSKPSPTAPAPGGAKQPLDFGVCYDSPLGLTMPEELEKPKTKAAKPEFEELTPFDMASIEDIRAQLVKKHVGPDNSSNNNSSSGSCEAGAASPTDKCKTSKASPEQQTTSELDIYADAFEDDV